MKLLQDFLNQIKILLKGIAVEKQAGPVAVEAEEKEISD